MSIATLVAPPDFTDNSLLGNWSFSNQDQHLNIVSTIYQKQKVLLTLYPLDPIPKTNWVGWLQLHQQAHNDFAGVLNIENYDLSSVNLQDRIQVEAWTRLHFDMHLQAAQVLGLN